MTIYKVTWSVVVPTKYSELPGSIMPLSPFTTVEATKYFRSMDAVTNYTRKLEEAALLLNQTVKPKVDAIGLEDA